MHMKRNKGFLFIEVMVSFVVSIALIFALLTYVERLLYYRRSTYLLEQAILAGAYSMDRAIHDKKRGLFLDGPFSVESLTIKHSDTISRIKSTVRWTESRKEQDNSKEKAITFWSVQLEE